MWRQNHVLDQCEQDVTILNGPKLVKHIFENVPVALLKMNLLEMNKHQPYLLNQGIVEKGNSGQEEAQPKMHHVWQQLVATVEQDFSPGGRAESSKHKTSTAWLIRKSNKL